MQHPSEGRHKADKQSPSTGTRTAQFLRLSRQNRETFHAHFAGARPSRLVQFLRIARGRTA